MSAYKIAEKNPNNNLLLLEKSSYTLDDYVNAGYDNIFNWSSAQNDPRFQYSFASDDNKSVWMGQGIGGGTLHFGLQYIDSEDLINKDYAEWSDFFRQVSLIADPDQYVYAYDSEYLPNPEYYAMKEHIDASAESLNINSYNNKVYSSDLSTSNRLLLGNLLDTLSNVTVQSNVFVDKIIFDDNSNAINLFDSNGNSYLGKDYILCAGAIQTPAILQRSGIDCGNKLYDHAGFTVMYAKMQAVETTTTTTQPYSGDETFTLDATNLEKLNTYNSGRSIFKVTGSNVNSGDVNKVYDFTSWASSHPGGSYAITKWTSNYTLQYPSWHSLERWNSYRSGFYRNRYVWGCIKL